jgi:hypothetical protein
LLLPLLALFPNFLEDEELLFVFVGDLEREMGILDWKFEALKLGNSEHPKRTIFL